MHGMEQVDPLGVDIEDAARKGERVAFPDLPL
jgi:hypothetical protein